MVSLIQKDVLFLMALAGALLLTANAYATRIYKSVDADGNVTYSSQPPSEAVHTERIALPRNYDVHTDADAMANIDAIKQTAEKFEMERKQREQERKEAQKKAEEAAKKQAKPPAEPEIRYYPAYPLYGYPGRPHPPRPRPPRPQPNPLPHKPVP